MKIKHCDRCKHIIAHQGHQALSHPVHLNIPDADCDAPAWLKNGLLNTKDDMVIPCALETETYDEKAEGNGKAPFTL